MLKASFSSKTVFTDTFLSKETEVRATVNLSVAPNIQHQMSDEENDASPQFSIKVFFDRHEKKVMYAECEHEFVDLLSFLVYPVTCVIENLARTSHLGCSLDNLYGSAVDIDANTLLKGHRHSYQTLLDPSISPFEAHRSKVAIKKWFCLCRVPYCPHHPRDGHCTCSVCSPQFVSDGTYVVGDDLPGFSSAGFEALV
jgi:hypothetical protein